jgi:hypothetical protein
MLEGTKFTGNADGSGFAGKGTTGDTGGAKRQRWREMGEMQRQITKSEVRSAKKACRFRPSLFALRTLSFFCLNPNDAPPTAIGL